MGIKFLPIVLAGVLLAFLPRQAFADQECYSPAESKALNLLRLHSNLMVIAVTCHQGSQAENLGTAYGAFTKKNISVLRQAEHTMMKYYDDHGRPGQDELDHLRTHLANEFAKKVADMSAPAFCDTYRDWVVAYETSSPAEVMEAAEQMKAPISNCQ